MAATSERENRTLPSVPEFLVGKAIAILAAEDVTGRWNQRNYELHCFLPEPGPFLCYRLAGDGERYGVVFHRRTQRPKSIMPIPNSIQFVAK